MTYLFLIFLGFSGIETHGINRLKKLRIEVSRETSKYLAIIKASQEKPVGLSNSRCPIVILNFTLWLSLGFSFTLFSEIITLNYQS
jgi:hypothetical protein